MSKIGFIVDSGSDVPQKIIDKYNMRELPLTVTFSHGSYLDKVEISTEEVFEGLEKEIPKTSLPNMSQLHAVFREMIEEGYQQIIAITISGNLSGTNNSIRIVAEDYDEIDSFVFDTKSVGIGSGLYAVAAAHYLDQGHDFETICQKLRDSLDLGHIFFHIADLKYLIAGGRIGKVMGSLGNLLNIQPIITCDEDGIYTTISKFRASKTKYAEKAINKFEELALQNAPNSSNFIMGFCGGNKKSQNIAKDLKDRIQSSLPPATASYSVPLSSALGVHTGPDLVGFATLELI